MTTTLAAPIQVSLSELLSALSFALDLTEGQPPGHTVRSCLIGMRLGEELGLGAGERSALYYALLLKDAGCSSNAARMAALFGSDDRQVKPRLKLVDWHRRATLALTTLRQTARGRGIGARVRHFARIARTPDMTCELIRLRCDRGAEIASQLGFPRETAEAIRSLDEHWCGRGYARGLAGEEIPLLARIASLAQAVEAHHAAGGVERAMEVVRARRGSWFDPDLADRVLHWRDDGAWWTRLAASAETDVIAAEPPDRTRQVDETGLDSVAAAFADIVDAKSPYTFQHSRRVADCAARIAEGLGHAPEEVRRIRRAGLLHDIGKLGVSNRILDKQGALDADERAAMQAHPRHGYEILRRVRAFDDIAWMSALHHERLDGSGYPWRLTARKLDPLARILAVADVYDALTSERPYRAALSPAEALAIMERERGTALCEKSLDELQRVVCSV